MQFSPHRTGENNAADQTRVMQDQMSGAAMSMPPDATQAFKAEYEALEVTNHRFVLKDIKLDGGEECEQEKIEN